MNNDLISRSELKKAINDFYDEFFDGCFSSALITYAKGVDEIIENEPTAPQDCSECKRYDSPYFEIKIDKEQLQELVDKAKAEVLASIEQGKWIPVSERLPEEKTNPITNDYYDYNCTFHLDDVDDVRVYKFGNGHWWLYGQMMDKYVTAWMPRPEPFIEKNKEILDANSKA